MEGLGFEAPRVAPAIEVYPIRHVAAAAAVTPSAETTLASVILENPLTDGDALEIRALVRLVGGTAATSTLRTRVGVTPLSGQSLGSIAVTGTAINLEGSYQGLWVVNQGNIQGGAFAVGALASGTLGATVEDNYTVDTPVAMTFPATYVELTALVTSTATITLDSGLIIVYHATYDPMRARVSPTLATAT